MEDKKPAEEISPERKLVREAIREVLRNNKGIDHIARTNPQEDGTFTPFITVIGHSFKSVIHYNNETITLEMYKPLVLDAKRFEEFREEIERIDRSISPVGGEGKSVRFCVTDKPKRLTITALIPINVKDGKEKIAEVFWARLSFIFTIISGLYFGTFDGSDEEVAAQFSSLRTA